jgi:hypothetical protein
MALKKYFVVKDIYHKGKLLKTGSIVVSENNHKYFEPYSKEEFSNEKEPPTIILKDQEGSNVQYDENGIVINPNEKKSVILKLNKQEKQQSIIKDKTKTAAAVVIEDENKNEDAF